MIEVIEVLYNFYVFEDEFYEFNKIKVKYLKY